MLVIEAARAGRIGLFAAGRGGDPSRHLPLLRSIADHGCTVIAPRFDMLASGIPTKAELDERIARLEASADAFARTDAPLVGIGHSIGTVTLLALAGAKARTLAGDTAISGSKWRFARLALMTPPTDFFRQPGALDDVEAVTRIWAGGKDRITPPVQAEFLRDELGSRAPVELLVEDDAGHFTYMDELPPNVLDPHPDRRAFLAALADDIGRFLTT